MARKKSAFYRLPSQIKEMTVPELKSYIKKAKPYMVRKVRNIEKSDFAGWSNTIDYLEEQEVTHTKFHLTDRDLISASKNHAAFVSRVSESALRKDVSPKQLQDTALFLNKIAKENESASMLANQFGYDMEQITDWFVDNGLPRSAESISEMFKSKRQISAGNKWLNKVINALMDEYGSDENGILDITYYKNNYTDSAEFTKEALEQIYLYAQENDLDIKKFLQGKKIL